MRTSKRQGCVGVSRTHDLWGCPQSRLVGYKYLDDSENILGKLVAMAGLLACLMMTR